ncbi:PstS family phosphate ABC transporter substrate-binding protein [Merismopedia glauca]|uniref:Phosphate ABC transporter substrate-binding protein n=1 Tax=Merismopedia glauca CCAP 1448/3 TaxID=1296344 RepID=A0A2T1C0X2_9CYAN|nr:PstS family phosphate ABC transporter substrate-binding protein [Merismopedia glauca]PSB01919.1 phosphate ABC transporter substrate-binding protein [Merismopedia glauca CCAP 1448/3]
MSQKNETTILVLSLLITLGLLGGGCWWFSKNGGLKIGNEPTPTGIGAETGTPKSSDTSATKSFEQVSNIPSGLFNYGGSTSWAPIRLTVDGQIQAARPEFRLRYVQPTNSPPSSTTGISQLIDGKLAFAQSSRPILDGEYQQAEQRGFKLQQIPVAIDGLAIAVNPNLNVPGVTVAGLKSIYTGAVTNWKQLGGPDVPIRAYSRPLNSGGTVDILFEEVLGKQRFGANVQLVNTTTEALRKVANSPGGIYYASAVEVVPQCTVKPLPIGSQGGEFIPPYQLPFIPLSQCPGQRNRLNGADFQSGKYPITRNLYVVVKQNGQIDEQAGKAYADLLLTPQGQDLIQQAGFIKVR